MKKLSLTVLALTLLTACGERGASPTAGDKPAPDAAQVQADVAAAQEEANAAIDGAERSRTETLSEEGAPQRAADYKRTMLGLIAGSYAGDCRTKAGAVARGAITVDPDGQVSAPGLQSHSLMDPDSVLTLALKGAGMAPSEITFMGGSDKARWNVSSQRSEDLTTVFAERGHPIRCVDARPPAQGRASTLYRALAGHFADTGGIMMCAEGKLMGIEQRIVFMPTGVRAGEQIFTLDDEQADEVVTVNGAEATLSYRYTVGDRVLMMLEVGRGGKVDKLTMLGFRGKNLGNCSRRGA